MAFVLVNVGGRGQVQRVIVGADDTYEFKRFHVGQTTKEMASVLIQECAQLGNPPVLFEITDIEAIALQNEMVTRRYPRLVKMGSTEQSKEGWHA